MGLCLILAASDSMATWTLNVLLVLVGLNLVILVHELGHFIVARWCGVKCEKFYIWFDIFGWKLFKLKWGETEYGLGVLPLGGYVKMLGQEDNPARLRQEIERAKAQHPDPSESLEHEIELAERALYDPRSYLAKSVPQRMAIISAGVIMNVVFAFVAAVLAYSMGVRQVECAIGAVFPGEAAWRAGLKVDDRFERIAGKPVERFDDLQRAVSVGDIDEGVTMVVRRPRPDGTDERLEMTLQPDRLRVVPTIGIESGSIPVLREEIPVLPGTPAARAREEPQAGDQILRKLQAGDRIIRIGDVPITSYGQIHSQLALHPDEPLKMTILRAGKGADGEPSASSADQQFTVKVAAARTRDLGLIMEMGPVTAIQADSPAARAGIRPGDRIEQIDGQPVGDPTHPAGDPMRLPDHFRRLAKQKRQVTLTLRREGEPEPIDVQVALRQADWYWTPFEYDANSPVSIPALGVAYRVLPRVRAVRQAKDDPDKDSPAAKAGLQGGEKILSVKLIPPKNQKSLDPDQLGQLPEGFEQAEVTVSFHEPEANWPIVPWLLQKTLPGTKAELELADGRTVTLVPVEVTDWHHPERGFRFQSLSFMQTAVSFSDAIQLGARETWDSLTLIFQTLRSLSTRQVSPKGLSGPVGIARIAFDYASRGLASLLIFLCLISANLAVLNFIPIPVLDGGHMLFLGYEGVRGKPPSERVLTTLTFAGLVLLLTLMIWVTGLDISRLFPQ